MEMVRAWFRLRYMQADPKAGLYLPNR